MLVHRGLNRLCMWVDYIAYRPAIVRLTIRLPRWWNCHFVRLSMWLDDRWETGYWDELEWAPDGLCEACNRRAAWLMIGGSWVDEPEIWDEDEEPEYLDRHPVHICFWCMPIFDTSERDDKAAIDLALVEAGRESIAWSWRWRTRDELDR